MSAINKKPFINALIDDMSREQIVTLSSLINGRGDQTFLLRTLNNKPVGNRTHLSSLDMGVHMCDLEVNFSLFRGYLIYTEHYCVLIHFTDAQVLGMFQINLSDLTQFSTVDEALSVLELRTIIDFKLIEAGEVAHVQIEDIESGNEPSGKVIQSDGEGGATWADLPEIPDVMRNFAPAYDETSTYEIGALVTHNGGLYECIVDISTAEEWNDAHWQQGSVASLVLGAINTGV